MKTFLQALLANLVTIALVIVGLLVIGGGVLAVLGPRDAVPALADRSVLLIDLDADWRDRRDEVEPNELLGALAAGRALPTRIVQRDALDAVRAAATDERIVGIAIVGDRAGASLTQLAELRAALAEFRTTSRKPIHAYFTTPALDAYFTGSVASTVSLNPSGTVELAGLAYEPVFLGGALEKLGVRMDVVRVGRYKSAIEPFTRRDMSPESRLQVAAMLEDRWRVLREGIGQSRGLDPVTVQALADTAPLLDAERAVAARLADRIAHFDSLLVDLARLTGTSRDSLRDVADGTLPSAIPHIALGDYARLIRARGGAPGGAVVALVVAEGDIVDGGEQRDNIAGDALARTLRALRRDAAVKAVVLRVNSPGGSAAASETIEREVALLAASRPVVVSMGEYAASGGYYIAAPATRIFAERTTLTGSIGIFGLFPNLSGLLGKLGVTTDSVGTAAYATQFNPGRGLTPAALRLLQGQVDRGYALFLQRVAEGRKLPVDSVRQLAEGRVWTGEDARPIGLVDEIGGLPAAIGAAARLARLGGDYRVQEYPRQKSTRELFGGLFGGGGDEPIARLTAIRAGALGSAAAPLLAQLDVLLRLNDPRHVYARLPFTLARP